MKKKAYICIFKKRKTHTKNNTHIIKKTHYFNDKTVFYIYVPINLFLHF